MTIRALAALALLLVVALALAVPTVLADDPDAPLGPTQIAGDLPPPETDGTAIIQWGGGSLYQLAVNGSTTTAPCPASTRCTHLLAAQLRQASPSSTIISDGSGGIRTHQSPQRPYSYSRVAHSTAPAPLRKTDGQQLRVCDNL